MMRPAVFSVLSVAVCSVFSVAAQSSVAEWPQLLGPSRNGAAASVIPPGATLSVAWKRPLPNGGAGIVVTGDHAYTIGSDGTDDYLFALRTSSGEEAWRVSLGATHADAAAMGPNSTPAVASDTLVVVSSACVVQAIDARSRQKIWAKDLGALYKSRFAARGGCGMSPLVTNNRAIVLTGAPGGPKIAAFDLKTGADIWTAIELPTSSGGAPGLLDVNTVLYHHNKPPGVSGVSALDASTGRVLWQIDNKDGVSNATPTAMGADRLLLETWQHVTAYDIPTRAALWSTREIAAQDSPAVFRAGHLYTFGGNSGEFLTCLDAGTGKVKWSNRIYRGTIAIAGDTLVVLSTSSGLLRLVAADPSGYRELSKVQVLAPGARTFTPPSIAGGRIFVRNPEEIVAVGLSR